MSLVKAVVLSFGENVHVSEVAYAGNCIEEAKTQAGKCKKALSGFTAVYVSLEEYEKLLNEVRGNDK